MIVKDGQLWGHGPDCWEDADGAVNCSCPDEDDEDTYDDLVDGDYDW